MPDGSIQSDAQTPGEPAIRRAMQGWAADLLYFVSLLAILNGLALLLIVGVWMIDGWDPMTWAGAGPTSALEVLVGHPAWGVPGVACHLLAIDLMMRVVVYRPIPFRCVLGSGVGVLIVVLNVFGSAVIMVTEGGSRSGLIFDAVIYNVLGLPCLVAVVAWMIVQFAPVEEIGC